MTKRSMMWKGYDLGDKIFYGCKASYASQSWHQSGTIRAVSVVMWTLRTGMGMEERIATYLLLWTQVESRQRNPLFPSINEPQSFIFSHLYTDCFLRLECLPSLILSSWWTSKPDLSQALSVLHEIFCTSSKELNVYSPVKCLVQTTHTYNWVVYKAAFINKWWITPTPGLQEVYSSMSHRAQFLSLALVVNNVWMNEWELNTEWRKGSQEEEEVHTTHLFTWKKSFEKAREKTKMVTKSGEGRSKRKEKWRRRKRSSSNSWTMSSGSGNSEGAKDGGRMSFLCLTQGRDFEKRQGIWGITVGPPKLPEHWVPITQPRTLWRWKEMASEGDLPNL